MNNQPHIIQVNITEDKSNSSIPKQMTKGLDARKLVDLLLLLIGEKKPSYDGFYDRGSMIV